MSTVAVTAVDLARIQFATTGNSLTVEGAASSHDALPVITVVALIFVPLVLLSQGGTYHVFRHRVSRDAPG